MVNEAPTYSTRDILDGAGHLIGRALSCNSCHEEIGKFYGNTNPENVLMLKERMISTGHTVDHLIEVIEQLSERIDELELQLSDQGLFDEPFSNYGG